MQLKEIMTPNVQVVHPHSTLQEAADLMKSLDVGPLPVCDGERLVGIVTDRDITVRAVAAGLDPWEGRVREVMTPEVIYCYDDDDVSVASRMMKEHQVRRVLVVDHDKRLVGIVSLGDIAVDTSDEHMAGTTLEAVSEPAAPKR